jgi:AcrR family transcriptional regulator
MTTPDVRTPHPPRGSDRAPSGVRVPRAPGRPRDTRCDEAIIEAALRELATVGFASLSMEAVATRAGVGKATVYRRWSRKEDLAVAAMEQLYRDEMPSPDTGSIRGDLKSMFASVLGFVNSPAGIDYVRTTIKESMRDDRIATLYREASLRAAASATEVFQRAITRGEVRPDIPVRAAVEFLGGLVAMRVITGEDLPGLDEADELVDLVLHGIGA